MSKTLAIAGAIVGAGLAAAGLVLAAGHRMKRHPAFSDVITMIKGIPHARMLRARFGRTTAALGASLQAQRYVWELKHKGQFVQIQTPQGRYFKLKKGGRNKYFLDEINITGQPIGERGRQGTARKIEEDLDYVLTYSCLPPPASERW